MVAQPVALQAGLHVLIEKPAAVTSTEAGDLLDMAEKLGRKVQVGAMRRHDPGIQYARAAIANGSSGVSP